MKKVLVLSGICAVVPLARGAVQTNVWQTAAGGSIHAATNWVGETADWTNKDTNHGFLDFRALDSGAAVTLADQITFSGFWFAPAPEATGPFMWRLPSDNLWVLGSGSVPLRVDEGELAFNGKTDAWVDHTIRKEGSGTLILQNTLANSQKYICNLRIDEGEVRIANNNALRHVTFREDESAGRLTVADTIQAYFFGRLFSTAMDKEPEDLGGRKVHIGGHVSDSVLAVPGTNGTYIARGQYTLMLGSLPESTEVQAYDGDLEICTLTPALRDCVGFWRLENPGDPIHDSGLRGNTLVASGNPKVVTDPERGNVLSLDGSSYLYGRNGNSLTGIPVTNDPYTIAFWVKTPVQSTGKGYAICHWGTITGNKCNFLKANNAGTLYHSHGDGNGTARNKTYGRNIQNGAWHHIVIAHDGNAQLRYYIDGALVDTADWSAYGTPQITRDNFQIGNPWSQTSEPFVGLVDDFLIMRRALSAAEIADLYAGHTDTANALPADLAFQSTGNGALRLAGDQTLDDLPGNGSLGGIRLQNGATLTVDGGSPATPTQVVVRTGLHGSGSFRKDSANLDLVASGSSDYSGGTEVAAGTLTLRTASDLAALWQFEDPDDLGRSSERVNALDVGPYSTTRATNDTERGAVVYATDGSNGYAVGGPYTGHSGFPVGNSPYTCAVWVKRDADCPNNGTFFWWGLANQTAQSVQFRFIDSYQKLALAHFGSGTGYNYIDFTLPAAMPAGEWHHVAATYDGKGTTSGGGTLSVYYDGTLVKRETTAKAISIPHAGTVIVGKYSGRSDRTFKGLMDDAYIYSRCLTDAEIAMLAAESGEPAQCGVPIQVPQPVAWYTFDDRASPGKDSSGNGYDLTPVGDVNVVDSPVKGGMLSLTGTVMSYLKYGDGVFPAKVPTGTKSLTITCWARTVQNTGLLGPAVAWGEAVASGSHSTILDIAGGDNNRCWRFVTLDNNSKAVSVSSMQTAITEGSDDLRLHHLAAVYDTSNKKWQLYVDGDLHADKNHTSGCSTPASNFYVGRKPSSDTVWFRGELDEVRVYDVPLTAEQVSEVIRYDLAEGRGVLPPSTTVAVAQDAALRVETVQSLRGLSGAGSVTVGSNSTLRVTAASDAFAGPLTGAGELALAAGATFPAASLAGFTGTVALEGGKLSGAAVPASCDARIPSGTTLALADAPFASVGGTLTVGGSGTIAWSGPRLAVGDYPLATASEIVLEEGAGWQTSPTYAKQPSPRFAVRDNGNGTKTLLFRVLANGTIVLFR